MERTFFLIGLGHVAGEVFSGIYQHIDFTRRGTIVLHALFYCQFSAGQQKSRLPGMPGLVEATFCKESIMNNELTHSPIVLVCFSFVNTSPLVGTVEVAR